MYAGSIFYLWLRKFSASYMGAYWCSPVLIFHSPFVHQSLCFPVPMFRDLIFPSSYIPQYLSSPTRYALCFPVSVFPSPFASQPLCSSAPLFPSLDIPHKWFPVPMFPKDIPQSLCSLRTFCSPNPLFRRTVFSPNFPQRCSPVPMLHISVSIPYGPQRYSPVYMLPSPFVP